jgi:uncharacterized protein YyaL (SSP411 family)
MNHLADQKSPYLLQHASNPVDWYPWGDKAFARAKNEDKPIFLSIGYSTCHWCHVMEKESFEDPEVAALMNAGFIAIKVDREERPDLDDHYMAACQLLTGSGGWPLTIVMTPEGRPFFAATYIPRDNAYGMLGMLQLLPKLTDVWKNRRPDVLSSAEAIARELGKDERKEGAGGGRGPWTIVESATALAKLFDSENGGFGSAPKFPMASVYHMLLRAWKKDRNPKTLQMVEQTLMSIRNGGIFDQIGGGVHRYSTDQKWLVPHFEKMLYDQALLSLAFTETWQATGKDFYEQSSRDILSYVMRDMTSPMGGFYSAEDADSEGEEGMFYVWMLGELRAVLGEKGLEDFRAIYPVSDGGNFSGRNIFYRDPGSTAPRGRAEEALLEAREKRVHPFKDDKVLADWNGLMIAAFARAGAAFEDPDLVAAAERAAEFVLQRMAAADGSLLHRWRDGEAAIPGFADDYAFFSWGLLELYAATFDTRYLRQVIALVDHFIYRFWDKDFGGFFQTADNADPGPGGRTRRLYDNVLPSANSVALMVLAKLGRYTGNIEYQEKAEAIARLYPAAMKSSPLASSFFVSAVDFALGSSLEIVVAGDPASEDTRAMIRALRQRFLPDAVVVFRPTDVESPDIVKIAAYAQAQATVNGKATAYVCRNFACRLPTNDIEVMLGQIDLVE